MISRFFILLLGAALMALAVLLIRPDAFGAAPVTLGDFESYRLFLIVSAGWMGAVIFVSAVLRRNYPKPDYAPVHAPAMAEAGGSSGEALPSARPLW